MNPALLLPALTLLTMEHSKENKQPQKNESRPPWSKIDLPKSVRKGKSWEEISEIKKQMWEKEQGVKG